MIRLLVLVLIGVALAATTGCEAVPITSPERWKSCSLADGQFTIRFPYDPVKKRDVQNNGSKSISSDSLSARYRSEIGFNASAANLGIDEPQFASITDVLDQAVSNAASSSNCVTKEISEIWLTDDIQGRDALLLAESGDYFRVRVYFSRKTGNLYQASVFGASKEIVYGENAKTFFESIAIEQ